LQPVFEKLVDAFNQAETVSVKTESGTDITLDITKREAKTCSGICKTPGSKMGFPDAEVYIAPR
jgi:leucyl aminopeptidase (aminopeptidase T)